jgi:hypothetical protein
MSLMIIAAGVVAVIAAVLALIWTMQRRLMYFPTAGVPVPRPDGHGHPLRPPLLQGPQGECQSGLRRAERRGHAGGGPHLARHPGRSAAVNFPLILRTLRSDSPSFRPLWLDPSSGVAQMQSREDGPIACRPQ